MRRAELFTPRELFISSLLQCPRGTSANEVFVRYGGCISFGGKLGVWPCLCGFRWQACAPFQQLVKRTEPPGTSWFARRLFIRSFFFITLRAHGPISSVLDE